MSFGDFVDRIFHPIGTALERIITPPGTGAAQAALTQSQNLAAQTAANVAQQEADKEAAIRAGQGAIDNDFSQFNDDYYGGYKQSYLDAYNPQLDTQYSLAKDKAIAALANQGVLDSSIAGNALGTLTNQYGTEKATIASNADDAVNTLKSNVNAAKTNLYNLNTSAADPTTVGNQAEATATSLLPQQTLSPLGDVFAGALTPITAAAKANQNGANSSIFNTQTANQNFYGAPTGGSGSSSVA
jgi:hypothetical protein